MQESDEQLKPGNQPESIHANATSHCQESIHDQDGLPSLRLKARENSRSKDSGDVRGNIGTASKKGDPGEPSQPAL